MNPSRSRRFVFFLALLIAPLIILGVMSFNSIRESSIVIEKQYYDQLNQVSEGLVEQNQKIEEELRSQVSLLALNKLQLGNSLNRLQRTSLSSPIPGLEGMMIWADSSIIYPSISWRPSQPEPSLSIAFEDSLAKFQHRTDLRKAHLQLRKNRAKNTQLSPIEHRENDRKIIYLYYQLKQYAQVIKYALQYERNYINTPLDIWLVKLKSYVKSSKYPQAYQIAFRLFNEIFEKKRDLGLYHSHYILNEMYNELLSDQNLKEEERKNLYTINENITMLFEDAMVAAESADLFNALLETLRSSNNNAIAWKDSTHYYLMQKISLENEIFYSGTRWDIKTINEWLLENMNLNRPAWKKESFVIQQNKNQLYTQNIKSELNLYKEIALKKSSLFDSFQIYQPREDELAKMIKNRSWFLYGILVVSFLLIIVGTFFVFRSFQKEQKLLFMKSNFLSSITHELKTPLTSIKMFSEMMYHGRIKSPEKTQEYGSLIHKETHRLQLMVDDILNYSKMEQGKEQVNFGAIDLNQLLGDIQSRIQPLLDNKSIQLSIDLQTPINEESPMVQGDFTKLESLFQNLLDNAIKYSPENSNILIVIVSENLNYLIQVIDQGIGMDKSELKSIFDLFYRVGDEMTRKTKGSGLGLAIAQRIATLHSTKIMVQSEPGVGSTFSIKLKKAQNA